MIKKLLFSLMLLSAVESVKAQIADQKNMPWTDASPNGQPGLYSKGTQLMQVFTAGMNGDMDSIDCPVEFASDCGSTQVLRFTEEIYEGEWGTSVKLVNTHIDSVYSPNRVYRTGYRLKTPVKVKCGQKYTMLITMMDNGTRCGQYNLANTVYANFVVSSMPPLLLNTAESQRYSSGSTNNCSLGYRTYVSNSADTIVSVSNGQFCKTGSVVLGASANSCNILWYTDAVGGVAIANGTSYTTPVLSATTTYYVSTTSLPNKRKAVVAANKVNADASVNGALLTAAETGATYQWLNCNSNNAFVANATSKTFTANTNGQYSVIVSKNSCVDTSDCIAVTAISNWTNLAAGNAFVLALKSNGTLWSWGSNVYGQLGVGSKDDTITSPVQVGTDADWAQISASAFSSLALKSDSTLWSWGDNYYGEVGDGTYTARTSPIKIGASKWRSISSGSFNSFAIRSDGTLWAWGENGDGQLCDGTYDDKNAPVQIGTAQWLSVSGGDSHVLAIKSDSTLWAWGGNVNGQLGDGTNMFSLSPIQISNAHWKMVSAGNQYSMALKSDGTLWSWGFNYFGQLGNGDSQVSSNTMGQVGSANNWSQIKASMLSHSIGIKNDKSLWAWGYNSSGQIGDGTKVDVLTPMHIGNDLWTLVVPGVEFSIGLKLDKSIFCGTGYNSAGQLGNGTQVDTNAYACGSAVITEVLEISDNKYLNVYPNPNAGIFTVTSVNEIPKNINVLDVTGRTVLTVNPNNETSTLVLEEFNDGVYFIKVQLMQNTETIKMVLQK
ncbi:MAG: T9SS type A sorting domain-containing protein [Bacteroidetes bacterium]|nr:T9SS type A sorting domain-containing protein [Bacteroidota bacterium]